MIFSEKNIKLIVKILIIYRLVVGVLFLLVTLLGIVALFLFGVGLLVPLVYTIIFTGVIFAEFIGLKYRRPWIVPLILIISIFSVISGLLTGSASEMYVVIIRFVSTGLAIFELYFFTNKKVHKHFKSKGVYLFGW